MKGGQRFELPQLGLAGSVVGDWLLVTDRADNALLRDMLRASSEPGQATLADELPPIGDDADAAITVALRHDHLATGVSVWSLSDEAGRVQVRMRASLEGQALGALREEVARLNRSKTPS